MYTAAESPEQNACAASADGRTITPWTSVFVQHVLGEPPPGRACQLMGREM